MNLPVMEDRWAVLAPLPLAMSILPAGNDSGFPSAGQRVMSRLYGPERQNAFADTRCDEPKSGGGFARHLRPPPRHGGPPSGCTVAPGIVPSIG